MVDKRAYDVIAATIAHMSHSVPISQNGLDNAPEIRL